MYAVIRPGEICKMPLEFGLLVPDGYAGFVFPKSGLSAQGIVCELPPIDSGYTGEIHAIISNIGNREYKIKMGDKVGIHKKENLFVEILLDFIW